MDIHEWEILSDDGLIDYKDDDDDDQKKKIISAKRSHSSSSASDAKIVFDMNYFLCPSSMDDSKHHITESPRPKQLIIPVHLQLDSPILKVPNDSQLMIGEEEDHQKKGVVMEADQETVTQVFFKKMKENEFVDMKIDSPRSSSSSNKGTTKAQQQVDIGHQYQFDDDEDEDAIIENKNITNSPRMNLMAQKSNKESGGDNKDEMNILKWSLNGIGAICSFGVAAATICILFYGGNQQQKLRIQIYTDDKQLKQAVQQATRLNEAIKAARGLPQTRAHITCGGRYAVL